MSSVVPKPAPIAEEDKLRADLYGLLSTLLARTPDKATLQAVAALEGDDTELGRAIRALALAARATDSITIDHEFHDLFIGLGRGELLPHASYYLTGFLHEKPLSHIRNDLLRFGVARAEDVSEPEDHIAQLLEVMQGLILGQFDAPASAQRDFFQSHVAPWVGHFFSDLESAKAAVFYAPLGSIGRHFIEIEKTAFRLES